jgi:putative addiction module killer protein
MRDDGGPANRRFCCSVCGVTRSSGGVRIRRLSLGNPGDVKPVGSGVSEMRIDYGPGYRVYFIRRGDTACVLLCGGDKRSQERDIARALELAQEI